GAEAGERHSIVKRPLHGGADSRTGRGCCVGDRARLGIAVRDCPTRAVGAIRRRVTAGVGLSFHHVVGRTRDARIGDSGAYLRNFVGRAAAVVTAVVEVTGDLAEAAGVVHDLDDGQRARLLLVIEGAGDQVVRARIDPG